MKSDERKCCTDEQGLPERHNPPGQPAIEYRVATQPVFARRMVENLSAQIVPPDGDPATAPRPLRSLTTRASDDGTMALIDAWASVCDVLTFYQERMFNEGFLHTAVEHLSVFEIARGVGYQPRPGVAASTHLAFTVEDAPGAPQEADVPAGTAVMSVPGQGEQPQTYETSSEISAKAEWNAMRPLQTQPHPIESGVDDLYLEGIATRLSVGDPLVILGLARKGDPDVEQWDLRFVTEVEIDAAASRTWVRLDRPLGNPPFTHPASTAQQVFTFRDRGSIFGYNAPDFRVMTTEIKSTFAGAIQGGNVKTKWPNFSLSGDAANQGSGAGQARIDLDTEYPKVVKDAWVCLQDRREVELFRVVQASPSWREDFSLASKCTRLALDGKENLDKFMRRSTVVHLQSEELAIAEAPRTDCVTGLVIEVQGELPALPAERWVMVRGFDDTTGEPLVELAQIKEAKPLEGQGATRLTLVQSLVGCFARETVEVLGNVVDATHGESVGAVMAPIANLPPGVPPPESGEMLGQGDATVPHQRFELRQPPLTHVPTGDPSGAASTLELLIGGQRWHSRNTLFGAGPDERVFKLDIDSEQRASVQLGDGRHGARAASGRPVVARYRKGIGIAGEVGAEQLTIMPNRPLGLRSVVNPLPASGAGDPDGPDDIRATAPLTILTLDRLVSVRDYEDFARAFAGIGKARAAELWDGKRSFLNVTVASASGKVLDPQSQTIEKLVEAFAVSQDPTHTAWVSPHAEVFFGLAIRVLAHPDMDKPLLEHAIRGALSNAFSFSMREFAQSVTRNEITTVVHGVPGVEAIDIDGLFRVGEASQRMLTAQPATWTGTEIRPAELLLLDPTHVTLGWMQ